MQPDPSLYISATLYAANRCQDILTWLRSNCTFGIEFEIQEQTHSFLNRSSTMLVVYGSGAETPCAGSENQALFFGLPNFFEHVYHIFNVPIRLTMEWAHSSPTAYYWGAVSEYKHVYDTTCAIEELLETITYIRPDQIPELTPRLKDLGTRLKTLSDKAIAATQGTWC